MLNWLSNPQLLLAGVILALAQGLAALPWLRAIDSREFDKAARTPSSLGTAVLAVLGLGVLLAAYLGYRGGSEGLQLDGKVYGSVLHLQLLVDFFILAPHALLLVAPKAGAVAQAAYREGWRQPMFWLITGFAVLLMLFSIWIPYFTFGDDYKMMKQIGFDICMLAAVLFGVIAASISIAEEIEGRTAITLMSKPINRRSFLLGKFLGILLACGAMTLILGWFLNWALIITPEYDKINQVTDPMSEQARQEIVPRVSRLLPGGADTAARAFAGGAGTWAAETVAHSVGLALGFGQVMILVAVASALATRLPFVVNLVVCMVVYFLGHLAPVVVKVTDQMRRESGEGGAAVGLVKFLGDVFDTLLPALQFFNMSPAIVRETPLDLWAFAGYVGSVFGYSVLYTVIVLVVGLLLFEDRDLA
jgi:hypothetical protein